jgi:gliding motility-associated-like protein
VACFNTSQQSLPVSAPTFQFTNCSSGGSSYQWFFGDPLNSTSTGQNPQFTYSQPGTYTVLLITCNSFGCCDTTLLALKVTDEHTLYVPNAFTPNGDGLNDGFLPVGIGIDGENFDMWIFDRWGNMIFHTDDPEKPWDGRANGGKEVAQQDVYVWKIVTRNDAHANKQYIGHVTLVK